MIHSLEEKLVQGYHKTTNFISKIPGETGILTVMGIALSILFPPFALPISITFGAMIAARIFVKIGEVSKSIFLREIIHQAELLNTRLPKLKPFLIVISLTLIWINPVVGAFAGGITGLYLGLHQPSLQNNQRPNRSKPQPLTQA